MPNLAYYFYVKRTNCRKCVSRKYPEKKGCFVALGPLELDVQATFCWFSPTNNMKVLLIDGCLSCILFPRSSAVSSVCALFAN